MVALSVRHLTLPTVDRRSDERRVGERLSLSVQVTLDFSDGANRWTEADAALLDLSEAGAFLRADRIPRHGQRILLGLMHPVLGLCAAAGSVVRYDGWGGFGAKFVSTNDAYQDLVRRLSLASTGRRTELIVGKVDVRAWIDWEPPPIHR